MTTLPETKYAKSGNISIAYQVAGDLIRPQQTKSQTREVASG